MNKVPDGGILSWLRRLFAGRPGHPALEFEADLDVAVKQLGLDMTRAELLERFGRKTTHETPKRS